MFLDILVEGAVSRVDLGKGRFTCFEIKGVGDSIKGESPHSQRLAGIHK